MCFRLLLLFLQGCSFHIPNKSKESKKKNGTNKKKEIIVVDIVVVAVIAASAPLYLPSLAVFNKFGLSHTHNFLFCCLLFFQLSVCYVYIENMSYNVNVIKFLFRVNVKISFLVVNMPFSSAKDTYTGVAVACYPHMHKNRKESSYRYVRTCLANKQQYNILSFFFFFCFHIKYGISYLHT